MRRAGLFLALVLGTVGVALGTVPLAGEDAFWPLAWLAWAPVGYMILLRRRGNGVGSASLLIGVSWGVVFLGSWVLDKMAAADNDSSSVAAWVEMVVAPFGVLPWLAIVWLILVFPSGDYPARPERVVGRMLLTIGGAVVASFILSSEVQDVSGMPSPLGVEQLAPLTGPIPSDQAFFLLIGLLFASIVLLVKRWRESGGIERVQYRWLLLGAAVFAVTVLIGNLIADNSSGQVIFLLGVWAIPVSVGVAVTKYRLFDLDRLISRTVSYTLVVGLLAAVFVGTVTLTTILLPAQNSLAVAASTLVAVALFNPLRKRVQGRVDRRFNRSRDDVEIVLQEFTNSLQGQADLDGVQVAWIKVVTATMQPSATAVWLKQR